MVRIPAIMVVKGIDRRQTARYEPLTRESPADIHAAPA
jgi:hypothetical protein